MPVLHQWDYLFAFGCIFSALDAFNIGANDVANSFATSVSSKSLTMRQAVLCAAVCEFLGAVLVGARVADTIKNGIIPLSVFQDNAGVQLLAFTCAICVSSVWLMIATRYSWPVSTTYSIISAVCGVGVAVGGADSVNWGWNGGKGMATIFAGMAIAPGMAGGFAAVMYLIVKFGVLVRKNPVQWALYTAPVIFFLVAAVCTMCIMFKGAPNLGLKDFEGASLAAAVVGTAAVIAALSILFWLPYIYCRVVRKDYTLRFYHFFLGPLLWWRKAPEDAGTEGAASSVPDYRVVKEEEHHVVASSTHESDLEKDGSSDVDTKASNHPSALNKEVEKAELHPIIGEWYLPANLWILVRYKALALLLHGTSVDIHALQAGQAGTANGDRMARTYAAATQYPNEVEHVYSFVQVLTACTASFAHGANDVSNAVAPFAVIYSVWSSGEPASSKAPVPIWILVAGACFLVVGLATYGYNIMAVLGNKITLHSPSRGFSMELGAAITVILAAQYGIPVSTTMSITGATIGVALCNGDLKSVNWRALGWIIMGWMLTIPVVGTGAGCLTGIILRAPHFL